jgi:glyoxylase-like metal-dependent hydrolase (beta-lactamase superfamily II)
VKVHHLNCGTMHLPGAELVCHVLLVETDHGLVLVDTGFGSHDCANPRARIGPFRHFIRPELRTEQTAAQQIEERGFELADVRHIVLTHFDLDHIGGLSDFPHATIHITTAEARGAIHAPSIRERVRFRRAQWSHGPHLVEHDPGGEPWRGFAAAKPLEDIDEGIVMVPMPGHTRGHVAVAVDAGHRWILHAGDAFYHPGNLDRRSAVPFVLRAQETLIAYDRKQVADNHARLAELHQRREPDLIVVCAHDPSLYRLARDTA